MIDQAGDVARGDLQLVGEFPEGQLAFRCGLERPQDVEPALPQAMLLGPAIHEPVSEPGGDTQRGHRLDGAHLLFGKRSARRAKGLTEAAVVQVSPSIGRQGAIESTVALNFGELHSEALHYVAFHERLSNSLFGTARVTSHPHRQASVTSGQMGAPSSGAYMPRVTACCQRGGLVPRISQAARTRAERS